ncbi:Adenine-specific DNA methylase, contains a Zn-ribbon domain [Desulfatibacillum alkenivorans DSM 16219]|jgi:adenine-specific DNA methylase|uniref:Adenine-specific DNA methylase, contains a Zn-ribbon domain n=1 Tax=Desulfatibacillum alkenivorans DSM 16219 TaxID=1121393 RepID=A0A1M6ZYJ9_9BACT|nr:DUF1156 domain-containing protein [Desulfatibacillum alkenivorans]SHL35552.1 Adenine-specific DNA methylase, contains a Zn-ribbon domain [Desulfatibacillum alkenivorans DSM 16219]
MSIEKSFDVSFISSLALREKQIQQNYRPIIAVHKWFARRPGTLFRGLLLSEFCDLPLSEAFYQTNDFSGIKLADPFMGGGTPLLEANRLGCDVVGADINPMAYWVVREEVESLDLDAYQASATQLTNFLEAEIGHFYRTRCTKCNSERAHVKYFLWVKTCDCRGCGKTYDLFPNYRIAKSRRHPKDVLICPSCGELNEVDDLNQLGNCVRCNSNLAMDGSAKRNSSICPFCGVKNKFPCQDFGPPKHRMIAIEYHCPQCRPMHAGRFFKKPDSVDLSKYKAAQALFHEMTPHFIPDDEIPDGDETKRLLRWGYRKYSELFNSRQLLGLETSARLISGQKSRRVRDALATNFSDLLRYQNLLCRYDTMALKSLDIFSIHGFPVSLIQCESNFLGITNGNGVNVGSGGWGNIIAKYAKAKAYCDQPFEVRFNNSKKVIVPINGEWIGEKRGSERRSVELYCQSSTDLEVPPESIDAVFTDPPYFGNVQYAELMDFCFVWLKKIIGRNRKGFARSSTRNPKELTGNVTLSRGLDDFADGLSKVFQKMAMALKSKGPLAFTFHHNTLEAYAPVIMAILDADLVCTKAIPCPGEMSGSIHINGTGSSIIDTVFVCRKNDSNDKGEANVTERLKTLVENDLSSLRAGSVKPSTGDIRCIYYGQMARIASVDLREGWDSSELPERKLRRILNRLYILDKHKRTIEKTSDI